MKTGKHLLQTKMFLESIFIDMDLYVMSQLMQTNLHISKLKYRSKHTSIQESYLLVRRSNHDICSRT